MSNHAFVNAGGVSAAFNGPLAKAKPVSLNDLWEKRSALMGDEAGQFYYLHVHSLSRPISLTEGSGWLAFVHPTGEANEWEVGLWAAQLQQYAVRSRDKDLQQVSNEICAMVTKVGPKIRILFDRPHGEGVRPSPSVG